MTIRVDNDTMDMFGRLSRKSYIPVGQDIMTNKEYLVGVKVLIDNRCKNLDGKKIISKSCLDSILMKVFKLRRYKARKVLDAYVVSGILSKYDDDNWIVNFVTPYVPLDPGTAEYCLVNLSNIDFKVYCRLKATYSYQTSKHPDSPASFSVSGPNGLLEMCGYCGDSGHNKKMMNEVLNFLCDSGLINVSKPTPLIGCDGDYKGRYRRLNAVMDRSVPRARIELKDYEEGHKYSGYYDYTPSPMYVNGRKCLYDRAAFYDRVVLSSLFEDDRNYDALNDGLIFQDVPERIEDRVESVLRRWKESGK